ncbi:MAG: guanine deaminase [Pseudomonadota bacterium]|jgi:guanine deaminase
MLQPQGLESYRVPGQTLALRGALFSLLRRPDPSDASIQSISDPAGQRRGLLFIPDGVIFIRDGLIQWVRPADAAAADIPADCPVHRYPDRLILPGFIDTHTHFPQLEVIGRMGHTLIDWLNHYTFPAEEKFSDLDHAQQTAQLFCAELARHGVTTASVFATVHRQSVDALFERAQAQGMRMLCGKVLMDRHCPEGLQDGPDHGLADTESLISRWHGHDRLRYSLTPRFAPTSSAEQMAMVGRLFQSSTGVHLQSHLAETQEEVAWVQALYPEQRSYLEVYQHFQQTGRGAIMGHSIYLNEQDRATMAQTQTAIAFCPSSNLFLGSGLFDLESTYEQGIPVGLGSDVGGGTSPNMFKTMLDAYKVLKLRSQTLTPEMAFYLATLGGAEALGIESVVGSLEVGKEADLIVVNPEATPLLAHRAAASQSLSDLLSALITLGDERCIEACYIQGRPVPV